MSRGLGDVYKRQLLGGIAVSVHGGGYEEEPADPLADCAGCEKVWFVDFHD